jgi:uncharacterized membrane protein HdeD (DUF308 family)
VTVAQLITGMIAMASLIIGLFFLRFWRNTKDRFFLYFALSFSIEGVHRIATTLAYDEHEDSPLHYLVRLLAYGLILWAILEKNLPSRKSKG